MSDVSGSIEDRIQALKRERKAVILAHNYQRGEVQDLADFTGDSLDLSRRAATTDAEVIVFCGVHFMAETASILSPDKTVLLPDPHAGCPMADMITTEQLRELKRSYPRAVVVCYVNSSAGVKAESDYCCTSANAPAVVASIKDGEEIIFVPDQYLGQHVTRKTGRPMILWNGFCPTHARIRDSDIARARKEHPRAVVMVHPECTEAVQSLADQVLSTGGMCRFAKDSDADSFIVGTETGILHRLRKGNPGKRFYPATEDAVCPNMRRIDPEKVLRSLENMEHEIRVPDEIRIRARRALDAMLAVTA
jgi:quinolinate synthase